MILGHLDRDCSNFWKKGETELFRTSEAMIFIQFWPKSTGFPFFIHSVFSHCISIFFLFNFSLLLHWFSISRMYYESVWVWILSMYEVVYVLFFNEKWRRWIVLFLSSLSLYVYQWWRKIKICPPLFSSPFLCAYVYIERKKDHCYSSSFLQWVCMYMVGSISEFCM